MFDFSWVRRLPPEAKSVYDRLEKAFDDLITMMATHSAGQILAEDKLVMQLANAVHQVGTALKNAGLEKQGADRPLFLWECHTNSEQRAKMILHLGLRESPDPDDVRTYIKTWCGKHDGDAAWANLRSTIARFRDALLPHLRPIVPSEMRPDQQSIASPPTVWYLDLDQISACVGRKKRGLEHYKHRKKDPLPPPDVAGGRGRKHEWKWSTIRPWLERTFDRDLSSVNPAQVARAGI